MTHSNVSTSWPLLSSNQSINLLKNIRNFQNITEIANYPYYQAGMYKYLYFEWCEFGLIRLVELWYSDKNRTKILRYDDVGDGAAWTGMSTTELYIQFSYEIVHSL